MSYKTILTVTGPGFGDGDLKLAAGLCEQVNAHLSVLVIALAAPPPIGSAGALSVAWLEEREEDMKRLEREPPRFRPCSPVFLCQPMSPATMSSSDGVTRQSAGVRDIPT